MIPRKLLAALVGLSLAAGTLGTASAHTATPTTTPAAGPSGTTTAPAAAASTTTEKAPANQSARVSGKAHRKHVSRRATGHVATKHTAREHVAGKLNVGRKIAAKRTNFQVAAHTAKRLRFSHLVKRGTKHV